MYWPKCLWSFSLGAPMQSWHQGTRQLHHWQQVDTVLLFFECYRAEYLTRQNNSCAAGACMLPQILH
jgi:hypothetical protein